MEGGLRKACFANGLCPPGDVDDDVALEEWLRGLCGGLTDARAREEASLDLDAAVAVARRGEVVQAVTYVALFRRALDTATHDASGGGWRA